MNALLGPSQSTKTPAKIEMSTMPGGMPSGHGLHSSRQRYQRLEHSEHDGPVAPSTHVVPLPKQRAGNGQGKGRQFRLSLANVPTPLAQPHISLALIGTMPFSGWLHCQPTLKRHAMGSQPVTLVPRIIQPLSHSSALPSGFCVTQ